MINNKLTKTIIDKFHLWYWEHNGNPINSNTSQSDRELSVPHLKIFYNINEVRNFEKTIDQFCTIYKLKEEYIEEDDCFNWVEINDSKEVIQE